jgi:hypothetical protein
MQALDILEDDVEIHRRLIVIVLSRMSLRMPWDTAQSPMLTLLHYIAPLVLLSSATHLVKMSNLAKPY